MSHLPQVIVHKPLPIVGGLLKRDILWIREISFPAPEDQATCIRRTCRRWWLFDSPVQSTCACYVFFRQKISSRSFVVVSRIICCLGMSSTLNCLALPTGDNEASYRLRHVMCDCVEGECECEGCLLELRSKSRNGSRGMLSGVDLVIAKILYLCHT